MIYLTSMCQCPNIIVNNNFIYRETIKTAIENHRSIVVKGEYIPFCWKNDFDTEYLKEIQYYCLVMSKDYIEKHFFNVKKYANVIEIRLDDSYCTVGINDRGKCWEVANV